MKTLRLFPLVRLTLVFIFTSQTALTQPKKNDWILSITGMMDASNERVSFLPNRMSTVDGNKRSFMLRLEPKIGYFLTNQIAIGLQFPFKSTFAEEPIVNNNIYSTDIMNGTISIGIGPFTRVLIGSQKILGVLELGGGAISIERSICFPNSNCSTTLYHIQGRFGLSALISRNFSLEATLGQNYQWNRGDVYYSFSQKQTLIDLGINLLF